MRAVADSRSVRVSPNWRACRITNKSNVSHLTLNMDGAHQAHRTQLVTSYSSIHGHLSIAQHEGSTAPEFISGGQDLRLGLLRSSPPSS